MLSYFPLSQGLNVALRICQITDPKMVSSLYYNLISRSALSGMMTLGKILLCWVSPLFVCMFLQLNLNAF